jgi:hypothetical protein
MSSRCHRHVIVDAARTLTFRSPSNCRGVAGALIRSDGMEQPHGSASGAGSTQAGPALADRNGLEQVHGDVVSVTVTADPGRDVLQRWDGLVAATPGTDVAQLSAWADVRRHAGFRPILALAEDADGPVGGALVLHRRLPALGSIGYLPLGPVLPAGGGGCAPPLPS